MMKPYHDQIEVETLKNQNFRKVVFTGKYAQVVLMSLKPKEDIGEEVHHHVDQFFRFEAGEGEVIIDSEKFSVTDGDAVVVPAGSNHNITNTSDSQELKIYTIYSPPNHPENTIHKTKEEAMEAEEDHHH